MENKKNLDPAVGPLTFGLDIGIASVGWAVLSERRIVDLGVRCFDAAEDPKEKISLNQARRAARTGRNRNAQRRSRLRRLAQLFLDVGLLTASARIDLFGDRHARGIPLQDIWELRAEALTRVLSGTEFARILHHLVKWRGYGSLRDAKDRAEAETEETGAESSVAITSDGTAKDGERPLGQQAGRDLPFGKALDKTAALMEHLLSKYQTVGNLVHRLSAGHDHSAPQEREAAALYSRAKRNHADGYERSYLRKYLRQEVHTIFENQRSLGNKFASAVVPGSKVLMKTVTIGSEQRSVTNMFEDQVLALFDEQYPPIVSTQLQQLVGTCALEPGEPRAPRESFSVERSRWLQTLNRLKVRVHGDSRGDRFLDASEQAVLVNLPYLKVDVTYSDLREALCENVGWPRDWRLASFAPLTYRSIATPQSDQISVVQPDGETERLLEIAVARIQKSDKKARKAATTEFREWMESEAQKGQLTFASVRTRLNLRIEQRFSMLRKRSILVLPETEAEHQLPLDSGADQPLRRGFFVKIRTSSDKLARHLPRHAMAMLKQWASRSEHRTLADLRSSVTPEHWPGGSWQFVVEEKVLVEPSVEEENTTKIEMAYTDAQAVEKDTRFDRLPGWHKLRRALEHIDPPLWHGLQAAWRAPLSEEGLKSAQRIDSIFDSLTLNFTDIEIETALSKLRPAYSGEAISALRDTVSSGFAHLSYLAVRTILPKLEEGYVYSEACRLSSGKYDHSGSRKRREPKKFLPALEKFLFRRISVRTNDVKRKPLRDGKYVEVVEKRYRDLANPVVARSFNQARNVLNALIQTYGSPAHISIELARDLSKPGELRKKLKRESDDRAKQKEKEREAFSTAYAVRNPTDALMRKVRMRNEQDCKCMYSGGEIDLDRLLDDDKYVEVDHILPKSRTADNSLDNQVLVLTGENQRKGNRTPYEWKGKAEPEWWRSFKVRVLGFPLMSDKKKRRLLLEELDEAEFTAGNLVDTRYVTRLFARAIREGLVFQHGVHAQDETIGPDDVGAVKLDRFMRARVRTPQGGVTAMLRGLWGLSKNREAGDLHHAVDACVVAAATPKLIQRLNEYNRFKEEVIITPNGTAVWRETGELLPDEVALAFVEKEFPQPFHPQMFHQEVMARLSRDGRTYLTKHGERKHYDFSNYLAAELQDVRPVTVSRLVQRYRRNNELHDANPKALRHVSIPLEHLTQDLLRIDRYPKQFIEQHDRLYTALSARLAQCEDNAQLAFANGHIDEALGGPIHTARIPWLYLTDEERENHAKRNGVRAKDVKSSFKSIPLTKLTLETLSKDILGEEIWRRDQLLIGALRDELSKPGAKASQVFANGFPKPISEKESERRRRQGITDFKPPMVKSIRIPDRSEIGFIIRGGIVGQGAPVSVLVTKNVKGNQLEFIPRYAARGIHRIGLPQQERSQDQAALLKNIQPPFELLPNEFVAIQHPNVIHCFAETRRRHDSHGRVLVDVEPLFPGGVFLGYYNNYEPSNGRPVLKLHDNAPFFLLADNSTVELSPLVLVERIRPNTRKNAVKSQEAGLIEYVLLKDIDAPKPRTFALTKEISRRVADAARFERVPIDNLGRAKGLMASSDHGLA